MMSGLLFLVGVLAGLGLLTEAKMETMRLHRSANELLKDVRHANIAHRRFMQGGVIPMNGGVLTIGAYFLNLTIGTGAGQQTFNVIVDTGSSNTAIPSVACPSCQAPGLYNHTASPTAQPLPCSNSMCANCIPTEVGSVAVPTPVPGQNASCLYGGASCHTPADHCGFAISYGGSSSATAGSITLDQACFAGTSLCSQIYVDEIHNEYPVATQTTGIVGFAFPANSCCPTCQPTILDSMVASGALAPEENLFGMCLNPSSGGQIDIGGLDTTKFNASDIKYTPVVKERWFNIVVKDLKVQGVSIGVPAFLYGIVNDGIGAFPDSGTGTVLISPFAFSQLQTLMLANFAALPGVGQLFGPTSQCVNLTANQVTAYPPMSFVIAGETSKHPDFELHMSGVNYLMNAGGSTYCLGIAGVPSIGAILGDVIMANYYIAFDRVNRRVGFAPIISC